MHHILQHLNDQSYVTGIVAVNSRSTRQYILLQKLSSAFEAEDLEEAQTLITDLRYVTRTGEAISKKLP